MTEVLLQLWDLHNQDLPKSVLHSLGLDYACKSTLVLYSGDVIILEENISRQVLFLCFG